MHERDLLKRRRGEWERLSHLVEQARRKGLSSLPPEGLASIGPLYRRAVSDLSLAKTHFPTSQVVGYLNLLVARSHALIYGGGHISWRGIIRFFTHTFPAAVREHAQAILFMAALFTLAGLVGAWGWHTQNPRITALLPTELVVTIQDIETDGESPWAAHQRPMMASFIMTNNIRVSMLAFALGVTFGVGTLWIIWYNGLMLGPLAVVFHQQGMGTVFWSLILPHGVLELPAIYFSAAAGWLIGKALLLPGEYPRLEAAKHAARKAVVLLGGTVLTLVVAGFIEGFFTPSAVEPTVKLLVAAATFGLFVMYLAQSGRRAHGE